MEEYNQEKQAGRFVRVPITESGLGEPEVLCDEAYSYGLDVNGSIIYYTDIKEEHGSFYQNGVLIDEDVYLPSICNAGDGGFAYLVDDTGRWRHIEDFTKWESGKTGR